MLSFSIFIFAIIFITPPLPLRHYFRHFHYFDAIDFFISLSPFASFAIAIIAIDIFIIISFTPLAPLLITLSYYFIIAIIDIISLTLFSPLILLTFIIDTPIIRHFH
jgi:hypothetical protein